MSEWIIKYSGKSSIEDTCCSWQATYLCNPHGIYGSSWVFLVRNNASQLLLVWWTRSEYRRKMSCTPCKYYPLIRRPNYSEPNYQLITIFSLYLQPLLLWNVWTMEAYQFNLYSVLYSHSFEIVFFDLILFSAKDFF